MPMHRKLIHRILLQILQHMPLLGRPNQLFPGLLGLGLSFMPAGTAHAAAYTGHAFHEIFRKLSWKAWPV